MCGGVIIIAGCWECERRTIRTLFSATTRHVYIYLMKPVLKFCNAKKPADEVHLIGRVCVRQMHPVHLISVSLIREQNNRRGQRLFIWAWKVRHRRAGHFTRVLLSIWLSTMGEKKLQPCLNSLTGGTALPTALFPLLLIRMIRRATEHSRSFNHLCSHSWLKRFG